MLREQVLEHELDVLEAGRVDGLVVGLEVVVVRFGLVVDAHADQPEDELADLDDQDALGLAVDTLFLHVVRHVAELPEFVPERPVDDVDLLLVGFEAVVVHELEALELVHERVQREPVVLQRLVGRERQVVVAAADLGQD